jgi:hypothetical protein
VEETILIGDYYTSLFRRVVTQVPDGAGGFTETSKDTPFKGYIAELSGAEVLRNNQLGTMATLELFTDENLNLNDRLADEAGTEFEVVWKYVNFHRRYLLKQVKIG